jgi:arylsulfatase A-like enzyme/Tfp pilus assembly protein PilF
MPRQIHRAHRRAWGLAIAAVAALMLGRCGRGGGTTRPNVLLVTIDTLRADHVGAYGDRAARTPVLDGIAARGARFANALASAPLTGPSHATLLTGLYPPVHGVRDNVAFPLDSRHRGLASLLKAQGYRTGAFVSAFPVAKAFGFGEGFDEFSEGFHEVLNAGSSAAERPANETVDAALGWLRRESQTPFFAWLHLYDPHAPYAPPAPFDAAFANRPYDGEIAFADSQLGRVTEWLKTSGREADTLVAVVADHGEGLGEHDEAGHSILVYQSTLHVPFLLAGPGVPTNLVEESRVSTVDLLPTLLGLLKLDVPGGLNGRDLGWALRGERSSPQALYGESLFARLNLRWSSLRTMVEGNWKLIQGPSAELYDLSRDPLELNDLAAAEPGRVKKLQEALRVAVRSMAPGGDSARASKVSAEQAERLRSLGYTSGSGGSGDIDKEGQPDPRKLVRTYERIQAASLAQGPAAEAAIKELVAITIKDPGNPHAQFALGNLAYRAGRLAHADRAFAKAIELDPDRPATRLAYGRLLRELGRLLESEKQLRIALEQTTADDVRTPVSLAETLIGLGKTDEARTLLKTALDRSPGHIEALRATGRLFVATGNPQEGIPYLVQAAAGADPEPWVEIARVHLDLGDPIKAEAAGAEALRRSPGHPWALAVMGHAFVLNGRRDEGIASLERAFAAQPRRPEAWRSLAAGFQAAGDERKAALCRTRATLISRGSAGNHS